MRRDRHRRHRLILAWFALGLLLGHLALAGLLEREPGLRDPDWQVLTQRLRQRRAEAADRPLVVVLGSSRTQLALDAATLSRTPGAPLVFNACSPGTGPLAQQVYLRRLRAAGIRPERIALEVMPPFFTDEGAIQEERFLHTEVFSLGELLAILRHTREPLRHVRHWVEAHLVPVAEQRRALQRRLLPRVLWSDTGEFGTDRDGHGWRPAPSDCTPDYRAGLLRLNLNQYAAALRSPRLCEARLARVEYLLGCCRAEGIECTLFLPPESSLFRRRMAPGVYAGLGAAVRRLGVAHDARTWLPDDEFIDGHHAAIEGTIHFTELFGRRVLGLTRREARRGGPAPSGPGRPGGSRPPGS